MDLVFSFDTEDYATPENADAVLWWATQLSERGVRGSFQMVGELVRRLKATGRTDVIDALRRHEIGTHTDYHSAHPTHPEALEGKSLEEGVAWVLRHEAPCQQVLMETFGRVPVSYCKPGDSWTPASLVALAATGVKVYCDSSMIQACGAPLWYAGMLCCRYDLAFDSFFSEDESEVERYPQEFDARAKRVGEQGVMIVYSHPNMLVTSRFWDEAFFKGKQISPEKCPPAPLRAPAHIQKLKDRIRTWLDGIVARPGLRTVDYSTVYRERSKNRRDLQALMDECGLAPGEEGRLPLREPNGKSFLPDNAFDSFSYNWPVHAEGFEGRELRKQMRQLIWTSAPALWSAPL
jgi:peptidoglycan/xylan/chitin deacetylase (PgdA/CDA1 family)